MRKQPFLYALILLLALSACARTAAPSPAPTESEPSETASLPTPEAVPTPSAEPSIWGARTYQETPPGIGMPSCVLDLSVPFTVEEGPGYDAINEYYLQYLLSIIPDRIEKYGSEEEQPPRGPSESMRFDVVYEDDLTVSFLFLNYHDWGGAHGMYHMSSDNFDVVTGQKLTFSDFFTDQDEARRRIVAEVQKQIREETEDVGYGESSEAGAKEYFDSDSFYLAQNGLVFYYQNTDLGNPTYGPHYFEIPNSLLEDIRIR